MGKSLDNSDEGSYEPRNLLEKAHLEILQALSDSGRTVIEMELLDSTEYKVIFPQGKAPVTKRKKVAK